MTKRSVPSVILLMLFTGGLYQFVWYVLVKDEMNREGANVPSAWWLLVPLANIWWLWEFAGGLERVTRGKQVQTSAFLYVFLLHVIGVAIVQASINQTIDERPGQLPMARLA